MTQQPSFDGLDAGRAARDQALDHYESNAFVQEARQTAFALCQRSGYETTDDLHEAIPEVPRGNYFGAILRHPYFLKWGETQSKRVEAKGRWIHRWRIGPAWQKYR